jgi:hypothetical protein
VARSWAANRCFDIEALCSQIYKSGGVRLVEEDYEEARLGGAAGR